jgi:uncharacterized RDD family membrane protein YckC
MDSGELEYAGFWSRVLASIVDTILVLLATAPLLMLFGLGTGFDLNDLANGGALPAVSPGSLIQNLLPAVVVIAFWATLQATPGKMLISARIVDAKTGGKPGLGQCILRYLGYFVSIIPFGLGLLWVAFDPRKQGWHDKIAGTVVVRSKHGTQPVSFSGAPPPLPRNGNAP